MNGEDTNLAIFQVLQDIGKDIAGLRGEVTANIANIKEDVTDLNNRLDKADEHQWWHSGLIVPFNLLVHAILNKMGWHI